MNKARGVIIVQPESLNYGIIFDPSPFLIYFSIFNKPGKVVNSKHFAIAI
ncbi:MAG TPA: hypothetical protein VFJ51_09310 [Nitrososphaeraceae archaeon]|nr:hypothetical protein [Nitrososphaeraceae archaeon]